MCFCNFYFNNLKVIPVLFFTGFFLEFISIPVIVGFTSAASLRTAILQLRPLLGLKIPKGKTGLRKSSGRDDEQKNFASLCTGSFYAFRSIALFLKVFVRFNFENYFIHKKCTGVRFPIDHQTILEKCPYTKNFWK